MHRLIRAAALAAILTVTVVACAQSKDTGLPAGPTVEPPKGTVVKVVDSAFDPSTQTIKPGETVIWNFEGSFPHNVLADSGLFNSHPDCAKSGAGCSAKGNSFSFTFKNAGEFEYYCIVHGTKGGFGQAGNMSGKIIVKA